MKLRLSWARRGAICPVLPLVPQVRAVLLGSSHGINAAASSLAPGPAAPGSPWEGLSSWDLDARLWLGVVELWRVGITALFSSKTFYFTLKYGRGLLCMYPEGREELGGRKQSGGSPGSCWRRVLPLHVSAQPLQLL